MEDDDDMMIPRYLPLPLSASDTHARVGICWMEIGNQMIRVGAHRHMLIKVGTQNHKLIKVSTQNHSDDC